jgi:hypothetical protein
MLTTAAYFRARAERSLRLWQLISDPDVSRDLRAQVEMHRALASQLDKHASPSWEPDQADVVIYNSAPVGEGRRFRSVGFATIAIMDGPSRSQKPS